MDRKLKLKRNTDSVKSKSYEEICQVDDIHITLKSCPFCKEEVEVKEIKREKDASTIAYTIGHTCKSGSRVMVSNTNLIDLTNHWNRRDGS